MAISPISKTFKRRQRLVFCDRQSIHVTDASRAVDVVGQLVKEETRGDYVRIVREEQDKAREQFHGASPTSLLGYDEARRRAPRLRFDVETVPQPSFTGIRDPKVDLARAAEYIDWTPFFHAWELRGVYPRILEDPKFGDAARELFDNARKSLDSMLTIFENRDLRRRADRPDSQSASKKALRAE